MSTHPHASDLVIVANRLPVHPNAEGDGWETSPGGLVSALMPILQGQEGVWVGWPGHTQVDEPFRHDGITNVPVGLTDQEVEDYYEGFSNSTLWPLYHDACQTPAYHRVWWKPYKEINKRFAEAAAEVAAEGAAVLVQDYHLQLVPGMLREMRPDLRIGFFLHIPFPPQELFAQLPWRKQVLEGLMGADVVGFQSIDGAQNFKRLAKRFLGYESSDKRIQVAKPDSEGVEREVIADAFPISIDLDRFEALCRDPKVIARAAQVRHRLGNDRKILLGVDRLDYTKGIDIRLRALQEVLQNHGKSSEDIVLIQVSVPSRESVDQYVEIRSRVEEMVGQINGEFAEVGVMAVHYLRRSLPQDELVAYYLAADVMLVTPFRDGMNLVAKEYAACRGQNTGVLVLSEFTGAAHELSDAVLVNPHDIDGMADAYIKAMDMPLEEQNQRMASLRQIIRSNTVFDWADAFVGAVQRVRGGKATTPTVSPVVAEGARAVSQGENK